MKNVADIYALSPMQKLMLLHAKTAGGEHDVLFNQIVYEIEGDLEPDAYQRAWQLMVDRHPVLRTMFVWQDGKEPLQVVREEVSLPWTVVDWRGLQAADQEEHLQKLLNADRKAGFDMLHPPLMRLNLIRLDDSNYWLVWSSHHIIIDRWCIGIIFDELKTAYEAFSRAGHPVLAPAPRYRSYIAWIAGRDEQEARSFWQNNLRNLKAGRLPTQLVQRDGVPELASTTLSLDPEATRTLRRFATEHNLTLGTLVNGAWALMLSAVTRTDDVLFGLTVSGRPAELPETASTVGCFINNVPLRVALDGQEQLLTWLADLQDRQLALQDHEYASQVQIQAWGATKSGGPLFDTLVVYQAPVTIPEPGSLEVRFARGGMQTGYPLTLGVVPLQDELRFTITYDQQRVSPKLVDQIGAALPQLLGMLCQPAAANLADLRNALSINDEGSAITAESGAVPALPQVYIPPRTAAEQALVQIWTEVLDVPRVSIEDHFFDLGGDSLNALRLLNLVDEQLGTNVPITLLFGNPTVSEMAAVISASQSGQSFDPILLPINQNGTRPPFFYAHGVYGDISSLTNVVPLLPDDQPFYGLQPLGMHPDQDPDRSIEAMAGHYVQAIRRVQPEGPFHLGGFCFGGVLAYEIARQLEQTGGEIALLAIIEGSAPREFHHHQPLYAPQRLQIIRNSAPQILRGNEEFGGWRIRERVQKRLNLSAVPKNGAGGLDNWDLEFDNLADYNATRPAIQHQLRDIHVDAIERYQPHPFGGKITLFRARYLPLKHTLFANIDPLRGWGSLAQGGVTVRYVEGSHIGILRQPHAAELAAALIGALDEAQKNGSS